MAGKRFPAGKGSGKRVAGKRFPAGKGSGKRVAGKRFPAGKRNDHKVKKIIYSDEISLLIKAFPRDIAALDKRSVLAKVNSQGSGR